MSTPTAGGRDGASTTLTTPQRRGMATTPATLPAPSPPARPSSTLQRLRSGGDAASTLQSSAVAAMGSMRSLRSHSSSFTTTTSLHAIAPKRTLKIVLIGDTGCGKTSIRHRFLTRTFFPSYRATIGADFITKTLPLDPKDPEGDKATLQIWDTAGQERFQSLGSAFYRGADAVIIAFDATKGEQGLERVKVWYEAFMRKAPGPEADEERRRFAWICVANKWDLVDEADGAGVGVEREKVWQVLDGLVERKEGQRDWGADEEEGGGGGKKPTGAKEPVDPEVVLSRPDPNRAEQQAASTPSSSRTTSSESGEQGQPTPISLKHFAHNGDASPTPAGKNRPSSRYRLSRKSLSSIAGAAGQSSQEAGVNEGLDDADGTATDQNGGTIKTVYATPYNTLTHAQRLSSSPAAVSHQQHSDSTSAASGAAAAATAAASSGFLSSWMRSKSKATGRSSGSGQDGRGHHKRQSIKSIEVFQISDQEESDVSDGSTAGGARSHRVAFPVSSSSSTVGRRKGVQETPPKSVHGGIGDGAGGGGRDRQRVDSTLSLNAPSVYHTPRGSTFFSMSPTPRTLSQQSVDKDDGSVKRLGVDSSSTTQLDTTPGLKHKPSIASSSVSVATLKPTVVGSTQALKAPESINDLFQPSPTSPPPPPPSSSPPRTPSTISLPIDPLPTPKPLPSGLEMPEEGFTLFYTSAKTGYNIDRLFQHVLQRIVTTTAYMEASNAASGGETAEERQQRETSEAEVMRRTIRLASGKNPNDRWFGCC